MRAPHPPRADAARSGCSCSSTAASIAPTTAARRGPTIAEGLPSDFGFPLAIDPADADSAYLIPLTADTDRVTPDGRVRVYETRDAGASWAPRGDGLPAEHAYLTVLREAFDWTGEGDAPRALLRGDFRRRVRLGRRRGELDHGRDPAAAGPVGQRLTARSRSLLRTS